MIEIREFRRMFEDGKRYLEGACTIQELHGSSAAVATAVRFWGGHPAIGQVALDWSRMIDRYWNECSHHSDPLSKREFLAWLERQLGVLRSGCWSAKGSSASQA